MLKMPFTFISNIQIIQFTALFILANVHMQRVKEKQLSESQSSL